MLLRIAERATISASLRQFLQGRQGAQSLLSLGQCRLQPYPFYDRWGDIWNVQT
jgi:hypothetical protein